MYVCLIIYVIFTSLIYRKPGPGAPGAEDHQGPQLYTKRPLPPRRLPGACRRLPRSDKTAQEAPKTPQDTPKRGPRGHKVGLHTAQDSPRALQDAPRWLQEEPRGHQHAPSGLQEASQEGPMRRKSLIFIGFSDVFCLLAFSAFRRSKKAQEANVFLCSFSCLPLPPSGFRQPQTAQNASKIAARRPKRPPRGPQDGPKTVQDGLQDG